MSDITMSIDQFETLTNFALRWATGVEAQELMRMLSKIESANGVRYFRMVVRWQESDYPLPSGVEFPRKWPPELQATITRLDQPISKQDVLDMIAARASSPSNILVTDDPEGLVGWSTLARRFG